MLAYGQAIWSRMDSEKIPLLSDLLGDDPDVGDLTNTKEQTPEEMEDILKSFAFRGRGKTSRRVG